MYPHTGFELIDESYIPSLPTEVTYRPLFMCAFTSDKGPEQLQVIEADFIKKFGEVSFSRHGQTLLQADRIINAGGKILAKRIVAPDATLANIVILAKVKKTLVQKTNAAGELLFEKDGVESTDNTGTPVMKNAVEVKYVAQTLSNVKNAGQIDVNVNTLYSTNPDTNGYATYPLFSIYDNGRGKSNKKFRISPDYEGSKNITFLRYQVDVLENTTTLESLLFGFDPERVYFGKAFNMNTVISNSSLQVKATQYDDYAKEFAKYLTDNAELPAQVTSIINEDILFGARRTSHKIDTIVINPASVNLSTPFGISLESGTNGAFGDAPINAATYEDEMTKFFDGTLDDNIYDLVKYPIEAIIDANYPEKIKRAIEAFVSFRQDCQYFRDMGMVSTVDEMKNLLYISTKNKFCSDYHLSYDVIDPYTRKQIRVTCGYTLAKILVNHFKLGRNRPLAGVLNDAVLEDAIEGTVNYIPKVTPKANQKQELDDMRVCYAAYLDNRLVLETQYTSQENYTQLSFTNNMLAIQEVIRAVRQRCPYTRYSFIDGEDLETYKNDVQAVLNKYTTNFKSLEFEYIQDDIMVQNKIFYAAIRVTFRDYVQAELFKIHAVNIASTTN